MMYNYLNGQAFSFAQILHEDGNKMSDKPNNKARKVCAALTVVVSIGIFLISMLQMNTYKKLKNNCTAEITGIVSDEYDDKREIQVESDGIFKTQKIETGLGIENRGEKIIIHYDPENPDTYYISNDVKNYRAAAVFGYAAGGFLLLFLAFISKVSNKNPKSTELPKYIHFDSDYCTFLFDDGDPGYEAEIKWEWNKLKTCSIYFDIDEVPENPRKSYLEMVKEKLAGEENVNLEINELIDRFPELKEIKPNKCYRELEKYISDGERTDCEIKNFIADYFLFKTDLIKSGSTKESLMDGIDLWSISAYRNGNVEFSADTSGIYVSDLRIVIRPDGKKEVRYENYENEEFCDII